MQEAKDIDSDCYSNSTTSEISETKEQLQDCLPVQKSEQESIVIEILQKGKKNFAKSFNKLVWVDKEAFGDIDQTFILKQFWNSRDNTIIVAWKPS